MSSRKNSFTLFSLTHPNTHKHTHPHTQLSPAQSLRKILLHIARPQCEHYIFRLLPLSFLEITRKKLGKEQSIFCGTTSLFRMHQSRTTCFPEMLISRIRQSPIPNGFLSSPRARRVKPFGKLMFGIMTWSGLVYLGLMHSG